MFWMLWTACGDPAEELADEVLGALSTCDAARLEAATAEGSRDEVLGRFEVACAAVSSLGAVGERTRAVEGTSWSVQVGAATVELGLEHDDGKLTRMRLAGDAAFQQALGRAMFPELTVVDIQVEDTTVPAGETIAWSATIAGYTPSDKTQLEVSAVAVSSMGEVVAEGPPAPVTAAKHPLRLAGQLTVPTPGRHALQVRVLDRSTGAKAGGQLELEVQ